MNKLHITILYIVFHTAAIKTSETPRGVYFPSQMPLRAAAAHLKTALEKDLNSHELQAALDRAQKAQASVNPHQVSYPFLDELIKDANKVLGKPSE